MLLCRPLAQQHLALAVQQPQQQLAGLCARFRLPAGWVLPYTCGTSQAMQRVCWKGQRCCWAAGCAAWRRLRQQKLRQGWVALLLSVALAMSAPGPCCTATYQQAFFYWALLLFCSTCHLQQLQHAG